MLRAQSNHCTITTYSFTVYYYLGRKCALILINFFVINFRDVKSTIANCGMYNLIVQINAATRYNATQTLEENGYFEFLHL